MFIDYRTKLSDEEVKRLDAIKEVLVNIEPEVADAVSYHRKNRPSWYPHEVVPWGRGEDYIEKPWAEEQSSLRPEIVVALETNLLTEDNLPYYHAQIERMLDQRGVWKEWNRLWTSEEAAHAEAMRDYLYLMRVMDPRMVHEGRAMVMQAGFDRAFADPLEILAYTSAQELATRISHLRTGQRAEEPIVLKLLGNISRDENFHFVFYRSVVKAVLARTPELMLRAIERQLYSFEMPGSGMSNFELRRATIANAGIYGAREHRDLVILPLLRFWGIADLSALSPEGRKNQEKILKLEKLLDRIVERQERKTKKSELP